MQRASPHLEGCGCRARWIEGWDSGWRWYVAIQVDTEGVGLESCCRGEGNSSVGTDEIHVTVMVGTGQV